jgi:hypothetical protein
MRDMPMNAVKSLRSKAESYLEKARRISDRQRARVLLVQAHNYLKRAEETEAEQLSARWSVGHGSAQAKLPAYIITETEIIGQAAFNEFSSKVPATMQSFG